MIGLMKKVFIFALFTFFSLSLFSVSFVHAQKSGSIDPSGPSSNTSEGSIDPNGPDSNSVVLENPLGNTDTIPEFIEKLLSIILKIGVPIVALFIIYSGFLFVWARGNPKALGEAKDTFLYTVLGAAILLGAWVLAQAIKGTVDALS